MKFIRTGMLYIFDQVNSLNLSDNDVLIVKVLKRIGIDNYLVAVATDGDTHQFTIKGKYLTPLRDTNIVIRHSSIMPLINKKDLEAIIKIIDEYNSGFLVTELETINRLRMIKEKVEAFNNIYDI